MSEPLSSKPLLNDKGTCYHCGCGHLTAEIERLTNKLNTDSQNFELECRKAEVEQLRHELDNERSAMRNVQECAESYRGEVERLQSILDATTGVAAENTRLRTDFAELQADYDESEKELKRLRAGLNAIEHAKDDILEENMRLRAALADQQPPKVGQPDA